LIGKKKNLNQELDIHDKNKIKGIASEFRTKLCTDIGTRETLQIKSKYNKLLFEPKPIKGVKGIVIITVLNTDKTIKYSPRNTPLTIKKLSSDEKGETVDYILNIRNYPQVKM
jgi:hypothetical protein